MFKNSHMRLLMNLVGIQLLGSAADETTDSAWIIPADVSADLLKDAIHYINQAEFSPPTFEEGVLAEHQLKRKTVPRLKAAFDDEGEGEDDDGMYKVSGPTVRKVIDDNDQPKKSSKKRKPRKKLTEEEKAEARKARRRNAKEKFLNIKSAEYVTKEDDETDSDADGPFFAREREQAKRPPVRIIAQGIDARQEPAKKVGRKRKATESASSDEDEDDEEEDEATSTDDDDDDDDSTSFIRKAMNGTLPQKENNETGETLLDGSDGESRKRRRLSEEKTQPDADLEMGGMDKKGEDDDEDEVPVVSRRPRIRTGFIVDEDDDE